MRDKGLSVLTAILVALASSACFGQSEQAGPGAQKQIRAGNQAWVEGMKQGRVDLIMATYAADAVDCNAEGNCIRGRAALTEHMREHMAKFGKAVSASVVSDGAVQQGQFLYEWGQAEASFRNGTKVRGRYLTAWHKEPDGTWKIFRNLVLPDR